MSCNTCNCNPCNCYPSIPSQWNTCSPTVTTCTPVACTPVPCVPTGLNLMYAPISTSNLELFKMPTTPKILIPAPGVGKLIVPLQIWNYLVFGTTPYADLAPAIPGLIMNLGTQNLVTDPGILGALANQTAQYQLPAYTFAGNLANQPLTLSTLTQPVVGDSVLYSYIIYTVVNI